MQANQIPWVLASVLWVPIAYAGGLGFAPLTFLMALPCLFAARETVIRPYMIALAIGFAYAALSATWSPMDRPLIIFDLAEGDFAIKSMALRVGLVTLLSSIIIAAALKTAPQFAQRMTDWFSVVVMAQLAVLLAFALIMDTMLDIATRMSSSRGEVVQNMVRNAQIATVAAVLLAGALRLRPDRFGPANIMRFAPIFLLGGVGGLCIALDSSAGALCAFLAIPAHYLMPRLGAWGWRALGALSAVYILSAPLIFSGLITAIGDAKSALPATAWWRLDIWGVVLEMIAQKPWLGWGLDALRTHDAVWPDGRFAGYPVIPNHSHNMVLHLWVETGLAGAALAAAAVGMLGWRLSVARTLAPIASGTAAGLWVTVMIVCSFSYSLWNEWWWALVGISAAFIVLINRQAQTGLSQSAGGPL